MGIFDFLRAKKDTAATAKNRQNPVRYLSMRAPVPAERIAEFGLVPGQQFAAQKSQKVGPKRGVGNGKI